MAEFNWTENSKAIFDEYVNMAPGPFRKRSEKSLVQGLENRFGVGGEVTEAGIMEVIKEVTPAQFLKLGIKKLAALLTEP